MSHVCFDWSTRIKLKNTRVCPTRECNIVRELYRITCHFYEGQSLTIVHALYTVAITKEQRYITNHYNRTMVVKLTVQPKVTTEL